MKGINDILRRLRDKYNINYSRNGFYWVGVQENFLVKIGNRYKFDEEKFKEWLNNKINNIPEGWLSLDEVAERFKKSRVQIFNIIKNNNIETLMIGRNKKKKAIYVKPESVERIIEKRKINLDW
jgi:predicted DNA-binding protein YlxM (UPF0122 family)